MDHQRRRPGDSRATADERGVASAIYGLVVCSATLAAASASGELSFVAVSVLVTVVVYWLAESYAHALARHAVEQEPLGWSGTLATLSQGWPMVSASFIPLGRCWPWVLGCVGLCRYQCLLGGRDRAVGGGWMDRFASQRVARLATTDIYRDECGLRLDDGGAQELAARVTTSGCAPLRCEAATTLAEHGCRRLWCWSVRSDLRLV